MSVFDLRGGCVSLGGREILHEIDVRVEPGEFVAVLGANGSGKTTLVRTLVGLVPLSRGTLEVFGTPLHRFREWPRLGYVPQRLAVGGGVPSTVREVVASGRIGRARRLRPMGRVDREAVDHALGDVGLSDRAQDAVATLSGGQQQRVLIARALAGEPDVLVLDEPTAGVDADSQDTLAGALGHLSQAGGSVVLVAHELGPLADLIGRAVVLGGGRVLSDGPPPEPEGHHAHPEHVHLHPHETAAPDRRSVLEPRTF
ncbi:MAG: ABC transporter ATP-binding protein [Actinobacteria bacterium]|nr:ABC transporter ATP-binding protein [Actinomycetota bacterium]MCA1721940.1 ABC transporter ATP-binding protein [Actinomycetota bacterium]